MDRWAALYRDVADNHLGVVHLRDAARHQLDPDVLRRRAGREAWAAPFPHVWLLPGSTPSWEVRTYAAVRSAGEPAFATSWSGAALHGLAAPPSKAYLLLPHRRRHKRHPGLRVRRSTIVAPQDALRIEGIPVTSLPRTALQLAADGAAPRRLRAFLIDAMQRRLCTIHEMLELLERVRGVPGRPRLDAAVSDLLRDQVDSMLELDTRSFVRGLGFQPHPAPFPLACPDGHVVHLDVAFPVHWHAIECDGAGAHMDRRSFETDRLRWSEIQRAGVTITWVTRQRLVDDRERLAAELVDAFSQPVRSRPPMRPAHDCRKHTK